MGCSCERRGEFGISHYFFLIIPKFLLPFLLSYVDTVALYWEICSLVLFEKSLNTS